MGRLPSWKELRADFLEHADEHANLRAVWRWTYENPDGSTELPVPQGQWVLEGGSPGSPHLFRAIAGRTINRLPKPSDTEPWRLWLDRMRAEGYARDVPPRRVSMQHIRNLEALGQIGRPLPPGFKNQHIEQVFRASAEFCFVNSLAEMNTTPPSQVADEPGDGQASEVKPNVGADSLGAEAVAERAAIPQGAVNSKRSPKEFVDDYRLRPPRRSYEKFAAQIGLSKDTLYAITQETRWVSDDNYKVVANACGCKPEDLHPTDVPRPERRRS